MQTSVFKSSIKHGLYVYLADYASLEQLPAAIRQQLGRAEFVLQFDLTAERSLGQEDPAEVLASLEAHGFHVQMPRDLENTLAAIAADVSAAASQG